MKRRIVYTIPLLLALTVLIGACSQPEPKSAKLRGEMVNFEKTVKISEHTPEGYLLKRGVEINLNDSNHFEVEIPLEKPTYFKVGRNWLYLEPGYDLDAYIDQKMPQIAVFTGNGGTPSMYLRNKPFPKAGSFLQGGRMLREDPSFETIKLKILETLDDYMDSLAAYPELPTNFVRLETARNYLSTAKSFETYPAYYLSFQRLGDNESWSQIMDSLSLLVNEDYKKYLELAGDDPEFLQLEEFRDIMAREYWKNKDMEAPVEVLDYLKTASLVGKLNSKGPIKEVLSEKSEVVAGIQTPLYVETIETAFEDYNSLLPGTDAADIKFYGKEGERFLKKDYKGKIVVVDIWATWCGPCIAQTPYFEELAKEFSDEPVEFLAVCTDLKGSKWEEYVSKKEGLATQLYTDNSEFGPYKVTGIPRFIVFGKDGKIIDAFAPYPSSGDLKKLLEESLANS